LGPLGHGVVFHAQFDLTGTSLALYGAGLVAIAVIAWFTVVRPALTGEYPTRTGNITRQQYPVGFWGVLAFNAALLMYLAGACLIALVPLILGAF
jgi:hypothetical protein